MDIGQGAGLAGASGVRPFLPPLLAGALARGDLGLDFSGSGWGFLESPAFLLALFVLVVLWYGAERSGAKRADARPLGAQGGAQTSAAARPDRRSFEAAVAVLGLVLGALLFAGSLAAGGHESWPGLAAGVACAALGWVALGGLFARVRERLNDDAGGLVTAYADGASLALAGVAILLPPLSFVALAGFVLLLVRGPRERDRKYAGLRVLR